MPLHVLLFALLLYVLRFGYDFGTSDQDELIPFLLHRLDPTLFANDWFVQTQAAGFNVRLYITLLLEGLATVFPVWLAVATLYVASWLGIAAAVFQLGYVLTRNAVASAGAVVVALVLTPQWTLGGNDLVHAMFVPSMLGWALGLWGIYLFLQKRWMFAGALLGIATWMQALVGMQLALVLGLVGLLDLLFSQPQGGIRFKNLLSFSVAFLVAALPSLLPLLAQQIDAPSSAVSTEVSLAYIFAYFRAPHHFLPLSYPMRSVLRFGALVLCGVVAFIYLSKHKALPQARWIMRVFSVVVGLTACAFVFTEVVPTFFGMKLQLFKLTVLLKLIFILVILAGLVYALPHNITNALARLIHPTPLLLTLTFAALGVAGWGISVQHPLAQSHIRPLQHTKTPLADVEAWARTTTAVDAVFAVPPSFSGFRSRAQRAIVINFKAYPFQDQHMAIWFERLLDIAPIDPPDRGGAPLIPHLDRAYETLTASDLLRLSETYAIDYIVRQQPLADTLTLSLVFSQDPWHVYATSWERGE